MFFCQKITFAGMDLKTFLQSGIIESFCLGISSDEENLLVKTMRDVYPEINREIEKVSVGLAGPAPELRKVKKSLVRTIYKAEAGENKKYIPLMDEITDTNGLLTFAKENNISESPEPYDIGFMMPLLSTKEIKNYAAWLRHEMPEEIHEGINEYIFILKGSCRMIIEGEEQDYTAGQLMLIPPDVRHRAIVTSAEPMLALVQRQLIMA
jgi:mannose-6-phosphate isomerase-like protein (cupin superfamily)